MCWATTSTVDRVRSETRDAQARTACPPTRQCHEGHRTLRSWMRPTRSPSVRSPLPPSPGPSGGACVLLKCAASESPPPPPPRLGPPRLGPHLPPPSTAALPAPLEREDRIKARRRSNASVGPHRRQTASAWTTPSGAVFGRRSRSLGGGGGGGGRRRAIPGGWRTHPRHEGTCGPPIRHRRSSPPPPCGRRTSPGGAPPPCRS